MAGEGRVCARVYPGTRHYSAFFLAIRATIWLGSPVEVPALHSSQNSVAYWKEERDVFASFIAPAWLLRLDVRAPV